MGEFSVLIYSISADSRQSQSRTERVVIGSPQGVILAGSPVWSSNNGLSGQAEKHCSNVLACTHVPYIGILE